MRSEPGAGSDPSAVVPGGSSRVTSRDIATAAGVSQATVSNVINRPHMVAAPTAEKVRAAMQSLGFVLNDSARALRQGRSRTLGVVTLDLSNPFWGEVTRGIESVATEHGYSVLVGASDERQDKEERLLQLFEEHRVGVVLVSSIDAGSAAIEGLYRRGTPVILLDERDPSGRYSSVSFDELEAARMVGRHLVEQGHRRIAFINGSHSVPWCRARAEGLRQGVAEDGVDPDRVITEITIETMTAQAAEPAVAELLVTADRPTAVFCANDMVAIGIYRELYRRGFQVPADFSLVGFDDNYFAGLLSPALTTIRQRPFEMGRRAAALAVAERPDDGTPVTVVFEPELMERESVLDLRRTDPHPG